METQHRRRIASDGFVNEELEEAKEKFKVAKEELKDVPKQQLLQGASQVRVQISQRSCSATRLRTPYRTSPYPFVTSADAQAWNHPPIMTGGAVDALARPQDFLNVDGYDRGLTVRLSDYIRDDLMLSLSADQLAQRLHVSLLQ